MKIIFLVHRFHTNLYFVAKSILNAGHKLEIIVPYREHYNTLIEDHTLLTPLKMKDEELTFKAIYFLLKSKKPDLIIIRYFSGKWILFSIISSLLRIKRVTYDQGPVYNDDFVKVLLRPFLKRLIKFRPIKRISPVKGIKGSFKEKFSTYIPFPIEPLISLDKRAYINEGVIKILCIGKLGQERKKHLLILSALEKINAKCSLTLIGITENYSFSDKDYFSELKKRCNSSNIFGGVRIIKNLPYPDTLKQYEQHDIFVLPSIEESLGFVVLEALAAALPVIVSDDAGSACYIKNGINGFIFKKNDELDLIQKLNYFINDPDSIRKFGRNAIEIIKKDHRPEEFVKKIIEL